MRPMVPRFSFRLTLAGAVLSFAALLAFGSEPVVCLCHALFGESAADEPLDNWFALSLAAPQ
jgi:hypothetical protein